MKTLKCAVLAALTTVLTGCIDLSFGTRERHVAPPPPKTEVVVVPGPADRGTVAEIDAAAQLTFDHERARSLEPIAGRPGLSPQAQVHFVNTVYRRLTFDNDKVRLLQALIRNPAFCEAAKETILSQISRLTFDQGKQAILAALNEQATRGQGPGRMMQPGPGPQPDGFRPVQPVQPLQPVQPVPGRPQ